MELHNSADLVRVLVLSAAVFGWPATDPAHADPPDYFARLIDAGNVGFEFYDPVREPRKHHGYTTFQYNVTYRSSFRYQWADRPNGRQVSIQPKIDQVRCTVANVVQLPETLNHDRRWSNSLVEHEFDHVAMTLDPRVRMLIEHLCEGTPNLAGILPPGTPVTDEVLERMIHEAVESRYQAVHKLLMANQNDLDVQTRHGVADLGDRRGYFGGLFAESNLKEHRFPFLEEVKPLLRTKSYREAALPYRFEN